MISGSDSGRCQPDTHAIFDDSITFPTFAEGDLVAERYVLGSSDRQSGIIFHAPALDLLTAIKITDGNTHQIVFVVRDKPNHSL
jgi:hypothetical protein